MRVREIKRETERETETERDRGGRGAPCHPRQNVSVRLRTVETYHAKPIKYYYDVPVPLTM